MENKVNDSNKKTKKQTKFKVNIKSKDDVKLQLLDFYNRKIKKLHIIILVIMIILYAIFFFTTFSSVRSGAYTVSEGTEVISFVENIKQTLLLDLVIIIAGITPYFYLSIIGVAQTFALVNSLAISYALRTCFMPTAFIGGLIQIIAVSLCIAVGLYYCRLSTKKTKYYHHSDFGIDDLKMQVYEIRQNKEKIEEINKKKEEKAKKIQDSNVKIPYLNFALIFVVCFVVQVVGILISMI